MVVKPSTFTNHAIRMAASTDDAWPQTMRAWIYSDASGGLEKAIKLQTDTSPPPKTLLEKDSILVHVSHTALNPADYKFSEMGLLSKLMVAVPASPGT